MKIMRKRYKRPGLPPGTLVYVGDNKHVKSTIKIFDYNTDSITETDIKNPDELATCLADNTVSWINITGLNDLGLIEKIGKIFDVHPLVLEDIVNTDHRPKFEEYDEYYYSIVKMLTYDDKKKEINSEQVSFILGKNYLITFQEIKGDVFDTIRERLRKNKGRVRREDSDYLCYTLMDSIVDNYFYVLETIAEETELLEGILLKNADSSVLQRIHQLKRQLIFIRKSVWPLREILNNIDRLESDLVKSSSKLFFRDVYDHTIHIIDTVENLRDIVTGMLDIYLSTVSNRMNEVMKVLTIIATIFIPLTFLAGIYGMNFQYMPELAWKFGYPLALTVMGSIGIIMLVFFKRKKWF
ncbi:magnesium/cobalt transporter CorA [bacterium]|nr:magnesium/cobalt transporter CorA [bacterium]MBU1063657.1 magnesium/cobalt transporter CorA [bacterium]MBU1633581.1 magnesium/cobalt transporter CorA [bacterium]MBU1872380.1 magnesium/cobalt transporter CorA [bacterium]